MVEQLRIVLDDNDFEAHIGTPLQLKQLQVTASHRSVTLEEYSSQCRESMQLHE
ncbi:hypothetical protein ACQSSU_30555 [Micromonospora echinospora]